MTPPAPSLRALSIRQPWATAIITGEKDIENRGWGPPEAATDRWIAIHASLSKPPQAAIEKLRKIVGAQHRLIKVTEWPRGEIIGLALIGESVTRSARRGSRRA